MLCTAVSHEVRAMECVAEPPTNGSGSDRCAARAGVPGRMVALATFQLLAMNTTLRLALVPGTC
eukprot:930595-Rhodomonas_salina.1